MEVLLRQSAPRLAYLMPDYHNPTGRLATAAERAETAELLRRYDVTPVIDETTAELRLDGAPEASVRRALRRGDHHRVSQQGVLGWTADRLDPRAT